jgi:predicted metal-dependent enzyme (double-stranded beta helix superfamily)
MSLLEARALLRGRSGMFDLDQFIADLRATLAERSRQPMKEVVARAVSDPAALIRAIGEPDKAGVQVLHKSPDLTVMNLLWAPKQLALPHDHRMAAVIGMYAGREDNMFWRRVPDATKFQIEPAGGEALGAGDVTILGHDVVHSVVNPLGRISAAIHVYLGNFLETERSMWDAETLVEAPYDINVVVQGMALQKREPRKSAAA